MKKPSLKTLQKNNWDICRKIIRLRDGNTCSLCDSPYELQVDHCFSRMCRELYYDTSNLTLLCGSCHTLKSFNKKDKILEVFEHVEAREGLGKFSQMRAIARSHRPFKDWSKRAYQEEIKENLTKQLEDAMKELIHE